MFKTEAQIKLENPVAMEGGNPRFVLNYQPAGGPEGRVPEGYEAVPDSGLANEYMRLQDDFVKWQQQLLQNQRVLHNRVAPIASNPPALNSVGMVNNMNQQSSMASSQPRKPVEITIPIRLVDDNEEEVVEKREVSTKQGCQPTSQAQISNPQWRSGPSVPVGAWQERPINAVRTPPEAPERCYPQPVEVLRPSFGKQPGMQTVFQSAPQVRQQTAPQNSFQQIPQSFQQMPLSNFQQMPQSSFQQMPQSSFQQMPQSNFQQAPQSGYQQMPHSSFQQHAPQSSFQQQPQSNFQQQQQQQQQQQHQPNFQQMPQSSFQQMPQSSFQQMPQSGYQAPQSNFQQPSQSGYQHMPPAPIQQMPHSNFQQAPQPNSQFANRNYQHPSNQAGPRPQTIPNNVTNPPSNNDDNINARFSSVVTLSNDKNAAPKDKVRSVVQLNNSENPTVVQGRPGPAPFQGKMVPREGDGSGERSSRSPSVPSSAGASAAPMSSRLVQQAVQQPLSGAAGTRISPPRVERQPSPPQHEPSPPFSGVKLRPVEARVSPPKVVAVTPPPSPPSSGPAPPPPPPPPLAKAPPPPPPPPMSDEERRTSTGKKIFSAANVPQLDAREELMMAIRQFGGSGNLKRSPHPALH